MTFKRFIEDNGFGLKYVTKYVCVEDPTVEIVVERGSISHDRPTGFNLLHNGGSDFTKGIASWYTLAEAKEAAEYYANRGWK